MFEALGSIPSKEKNTKNYSDSFIYKNLKTGKSDCKNQNNGYHLQGGDDRKGKQKSFRGVGNIFIYFFTWITYLFKVNFVI